MCSNNLDKKVVLNSPEELITNYFVTHAQQEMA